MSESDWTGTKVTRAPVVRIYDVADRMVLLSPTGTGKRLDGASADLARAVLTFVEHPTTGAEIRAHVEELSGGPLEDPRVLWQLLDLLAECGAIVRGDSDRPSTRATPRRHAPRRVLLGITGAVASMHTPAVIEQLQRRGLVVRVAATDDALRLVRPEAIELLTHHPVVSSIWDDGQRRVPHIELAQWADAVVIDPASATTISRLATGDYASVVSAIALTARGPVMVVPSMNPAMFASSAVARNIAQLVADGLHVVHPGRGLEVADAPGERTPVLGAAPPPSVVAALVETMLADSTTARPRDAGDWDDVYRSRPATELGWHTDELDEDLDRLLTELLPSPASVLDVGTGLGVIAVECARRGHRVVATDISEVALQRAQANAPRAGVVWVQDDASASRLHGHFDLAIDRGCLHLLTDSQRKGWAGAMRRLIAPGGAVLIKILADREAAPRGAYGLSTEDLRTLIGPHFRIESEAQSTLPGPGETPAARVLVLRRSDA